MDSPLPYPLNTKFSHLHFIKQRTANEWSAECPVCGDSGHVGNDWPDRFRMFNDDKPLGWCRSCGHIEYAEDSNDLRPSPEKLAEIQQSRQRLAEQERQRLNAKITELQKTAVWEAWHNTMSEAHRALWRQAGIPDEFQDYWQLGFTTYETREFTSPALTIPFFGSGWEAKTIQYRLTNPPQPNDKYRFQAGLKAQLWKAEPDTDIKNAVLMCEGMKKAAVSFIELVAKASKQLTVTAVPSKMPGQDILRGLANADPLFVCLDPDVSSKELYRIVKMLPNVPKRLVKLPAKADDFFTMYRGTPNDFMSYLNLARPI